MERQPCVYILASRRNGTLYIGVTSTLGKRIWEHKAEAVADFFKLYAVPTLVWHEIHETMESAIHREKTLKKWRRQWQIRLINAFNPEWKELYETIV